MYRSRRIYHRDVVNSRGQRHQATTTLRETASAHAAPVRLPQRLNYATLGRGDRTVEVAQPARGFFRYNQPTWGTSAASQIRVAAPIRQSRDARRKRLELQRLPTL